MIGDKSLYLFDPDRKFSTHVSKGSIKNLIDRRRRQTGHGDKPLHRFTPPRVDENIPMT